MVRNFSQIQADVGPRQERVAAAENQALAGASEGETGVFVGGVPFEGARTFQAQPGEAEEFGLTREQEFAEGLSEADLQRPDVQAELADAIAAGTVSRDLLKSLPPEMQARAQPSASVATAAGTIAGSPQDVIARLSENAGGGGGAGEGVQSVGQVQAIQASRAVVEQRQLQQDEAKAERLRVTRFQDEENRRIEATAALVTPELGFVDEERRGQVAAEIATDVEKSIGKPPVTGVLGRSRFVPRNLREKVERYEERRRKKLRGHVQLRVFKEKWLKQVEEMDSRMQARIDRAAEAGVKVKQAAQLRTIQANNAEYKRVQTVLEKQGDAPEMGSVRRLYNTGAGGLSEPAMDNLEARAGWDQDSAAYMQAYNDSDIVKYGETMGRPVTEAVSVDGGQAERMKDLLRKTEGSMEKRVNAAVAILPKKDQAPARRLAAEFAKDIALQNMDTARTEEQRKMQSLSEEEGLQNWLGGLVSSGDANSIATEITGGDTRVLRETPASQAGSVLRDAILDRPELRESPYAERWLKDQESDPNSEVSQMMRRMPAVIRDVHRQQHEEDQRIQEADEAALVKTRTKERGDISTTINMAKRGRVYRIARGKTELTNVKTSKPGSSPTFAAKKAQPGYWPAESKVDFDSARDQLARTVQDPVLYQEGLEAIDAAQKVWDASAQGEAARRGNWFQRAGGFVLDRGPLAAIERFRAGQSAEQGVAFEEANQKRLAEIEQRQSVEDEKTAQAETVRTQERITTLETYLQQSPGDVEAKKLLDGLKATQTGGE